jgi:5-(aminomethyl)-3-furanmethanol phosphate kinase
MRAESDDGPVVVVKVGGSLLTWSELPERLARWLGSADFLEAERRTRLVLIVGGGPAADFVRTLDAMHRLGDEPAHRLALHAMDFTAEALARLLPAARVVHRLVELPTAWRAGLRPILAPRLYLEEVDERRADRLAFSWDVTSDAIAARVAVDLRASRLVLLKSASAPRAVTRADAAAAGLVDPCFPAVSEPLDQVEIVDLRASDAARRVLMK